MIKSTPGDVKMKIVLAIPVYNEEAILERNVKKLWDFCRHNLADYEVIIVIANNNSNDATAQIANELAAANSQIKHFFISQKGKGLAIASAWKEFEADLYGFMDADLSTDLSALLTALQEIKTGADLVIGSRFHPESKVERSLFRRFISQGYRWFFKSLFGLKFNDFPCGFKVTTKKIRDEIISRLQNTGFFWDTELIVLTYQAGLRIKEIPVVWREVVTAGRKSRVKIIKTSLNYFRESLRLRWRLLK